MNLFERAREAGVEGFLHCAELEKLAELASGRDVLEVGSFRGLSAWGMAQTARTLHCIDTFRAWTNGQTQGQEITTLEDFRRATAGFSNVTYGVSTSEEAERLIASRGYTYDFIFLDAMHTYEDVKADIARWLPRLRLGGVLALHDYGHHDFPGVKQAADEAFGPATDTSVCITLRWVSV